MVVGDGRMDVDVDVDVVMLVCGCEPGKGPLPGRAQPEVRHCSVTWYRPREGGKLEVLGLAGLSSPPRWLGEATKVPSQVRCTVVDHVCVCHPCKSQAPIVDVPHHWAVVYCCAVLLPRFGRVYHGRSILYVARANQARGACDPHFVYTQRVYLDYQQAASLL